MLLVADLETSDLLKRDLALSDPAQPWIVSVAAMLCALDGKPVDFFHAHVRSDGRKVRDGASAVHGITSRAAGRNGVSETAALGMLIGFAAQATHLIGYGVEFDRDVALATLARLGKDPQILIRPGLEVVDVMKAAAPVCRIPSGRDDGQYKWPSLDEACESILQMPPREGPHSAWSDCERARLLFLALRERKILEIAA